jgi:propanediol dehydratase small subunit
VSRAFSGKPAEELTVDALVRGELVTDDVRIHPYTLEEQAAVAERHGNPQLAANFRRAAELTRFSETEILAFYEALRPRRSTMEELGALAYELAAREAPRCAALVREAAAAYAARGLLR